MGILDQAKNIINGKDPNAKGAVDVQIDGRVDRIDQCKIIWYQWAKEIATAPKTAFSVGLQNPLSGTNSDLSAARSYDISNHLEVATFGKTMREAAGSFSFTLSNSFDWARYMKPGQWILMFLSSEGDLTLPQEKSAGTSTLLVSPVSPDIGSGDFAQALGGLTGTLNATPELPLPAGPDSDEISNYSDKLRCLGIIQRVAIKSTTNADGTVEITYTITGKDFGAIYDDTELWFNAANSEAADFVSLINSTTKEFQRNLGSLLDIYHDVFLNTKKVLPPSETNFKTFIPQQWVMPDKLCADLDLSFDGPTYFGNLSDLREFSPTAFENPDPNPLAGLQGFCWERLKNISQPDFHELFTELADDGSPKLYFRPIPWALDKTAYPTLGHYMLKYADLGSGKELQPLPPVAGAAFNPFSTLAKSDVNVRTQHTVAVNPVEVESFDLGADIHNRANFFLVDSMRSSWDQTNSFALMSKNLVTPFPFRNENDIKRYGFKPMFSSLNSFNISNSGLFGNDPIRKFMLEATEILRDFYANAEDFYSGTMLVFGKNEIRLGKVLVTNSDFRGIADMLFYIEGYEDTFTVDAEGTGVWMQSLNLTRGIQKDVLKGANIKDRQVTRPETFHAFNKGAKKSTDSVLSKVKGFLTDPLG